MTDEEAAIAERITYLIHEHETVPSDAFVHITPALSDGETIGHEVQLGVERYGQWVYAGARPYTLRYLDQLDHYPDAWRELAKRLWVELGKFWERVNQEYLT